MIARISRLLANGASGRAVAAGDADKAASLLGAAGRNLPRGLGPDRPLIVLRQPAVEYAQAAEYVPATDRAGRMVWQDDERDLHVVNRADEATASQVMEPLYRMVPGFRLTSDQIIAALTR